MDPVSIASTASGLVTLSTNLFSFIFNTGLVDESIRVLGIEIESLSKVLLAIVNSLNDPDQASAALSTPPARQHWRNVQDLLENCRDTLNEFEQILVAIGFSEFPVLRRPAKLIHMTLKAGEISLIRQKIVSYREMLNMSLQMIAISLVLNSEASNENLSTKVDEISSKLDAINHSIQEFGVLLPWPKERLPTDSQHNDVDSRVLNNLKVCTRSAKRFVSAASSILSSRSESSLIAHDSSQTDSAIGPYLTTRQKQSVESWMLSPVIDEEEEAAEAGNVSTVSASQTDVMHLSGDFTTVASGNETVSTQYSQPALQEVRRGDSDSDLEADLIEHWQKMGSQNIREGHYTEAELYLKKALHRSESKHKRDTPFEGRDGTLELLATTYCHQGKMLEVETILNRYDPSYEGRPHTLTMLISTYCKNHMWEEAEMVLLKYSEPNMKDKRLQSLVLECCEQSQWQAAENFLFKHTNFEGRDAALKDVAFACHRCNQWGTAARLLLEHLKDNSDDDLAMLEARHVLADVYFKNSQLDLAELHCKRVVEGRKRAVGRRHILFYESVVLLMKIYMAKGDMIEAEGYGALLPPDFQDSCQDFQEILDLECLSHMQPDEAAEKIGTGLFKDLFVPTDIRLAELKQTIRERRPFCSDNGYYSLIHAFTELGRDKLVQRMIEKGIEIDVKDDRGRTPLFIAVENGHHSVVELLVKKGTNLNARDCQGKTAVFIAADSGREDMLRLLLENGADVESVILQLGEGSTTLLAAVAAGRENIVQVLIEHGADISVRDETGCTALYLAAVEGYLAIARALLQKGANVNTVCNNGFSALMASIEQLGNEDIAKLLLDNGADPNIKTREGITALWIATKWGYRNIVHLLLDHGAQVNAKIDSAGKTALHQAVLNDDLDIVRMLLENKAAVNALTNNGLTPLLISVEAGYDSVTKLLLDYKADVSARNGTGATPLYLSVSKGLYNIVQLLLVYGAKTYATLDNDGTTALHAAALGGYDDIAQVLLEHGAPIDAKNRGGETPLHIAAARGHEATVWLLLTKGANSLIPTNSGMTPFETARRNGHMTIVRLLKNSRPKAPVLNWEWTSRAFSKKRSRYISTSTHLSR